jgi:hypothetical protein
MRLRAGVGWPAFLARAAALAAQRVPFDLPALAVADLDGFLALCPTAPDPALQALADACVGGLSAAREAMLQRWGYPDVFATWRFHMTLTRRLDAAEKALYRPAAEAHFAAALARPRRVADVCVFVQDAPDAAFRLATRLAFGAAPALSPRKAR